MLFVEVRVDRPIVEKTVGVDENSYRVTKCSGYLPISYPIDNSCSHLSSNMPRPTEKSTPECFTPRPPCKCLCSVHVMQIQLRLAFPLFSCLYRIISCASTTDSNHCTWKHELLPICSSIRPRIRWFSAIPLHNLECQFWPVMWRRETILPCQTSLLMFPWASSICHSKNEAAFGWILGWTPRVERPIKCKLSLQCSEYHTWSSMTTLRFSGTS